MEQDDQASPRPQVQCAKHGRTDYCLICQHLQEQSGLGYFASTAEEYAPAQAWCEACDQVLDEERGWNDRAEAFADWKLFCAVCYAETLASHELIAWVVGSDEAEPSGESRTGSV